ncbi:DUF2688 domain-containing protein [Salmonella enterica]|nr:DUF2688 domain-containing protein [Salmonella enterica]
MKNTLIHTHCKRCGCSLTMLKHSVFGANSLKAELGQICAECLTPDSKEIMELAVRRVCEPTLTLHRRGH